MRLADTNMNRPHFASIRRTAALALPAMAWLMASALALAQAPAGAQATPPPLPPPQLAGRWELNVQASDQPPTLNSPSGAGEDNRGGGGRGGGRGGGMGGRHGTGGESGKSGKSPESTAAREEMERALEAPRLLLIVQHETSLSLTDEEGRVTALKPDGSKVTEQLAGASIERTTKWDARSLITTTKLSNGARVTQTFTKVSEGLQLVVVTRIDGGHLPSPVAVKRVYDQAFQ